jgi:hypothetical protein
VLGTISLLWMYKAFINSTAAWRIGKRSDFSGHFVAGSVGFWRASCDSLTGRWNPAPLLHIACSILDALFTFHPFARNGYQAAEMIGAASRGCSHGDHRSLNRLCRCLESLPQASRTRTRSSLHASDRTLFSLATSQVHHFSEKLSLESCGGQLPKSLVKAGMYRSCLQRSCAYYVVVGYLPYLVQRLDECSEIVPWSLVRWQCWLD